MEEVNRITRPEKNRTRGNGETTPRQRILKVRSLGLRTPVQTAGTITFVPKVSRDEACRW